MIETATADLILTGGKIVTLDPRSQIAGAVAVAEVDPSRVRRQPDQFGVAANRDNAMR
ncbi:MAG: hypothetical protein OEU46_07745 [Alphaproteobacteria bacterium]|nr:hypothetical protein [Alphaproteobacteria bacterium]